MTGTRSCAAMLMSLAAIVLIGAACSSDDLSADEYRAEADQICRSAEQAIGAPALASDPAGAADELRKALPALERQVSGLENLDPPGELAGDHDESMELLNEQLDLVSELVQRIDAGDEAPIIIAQEIVPRLQGLAARSDAKARDLGLVECGQPMPNGTAESPQEAAEDAREGESPPRGLFRTNFVTACSQLYPSPACNCIVDQISEAHPDDESFIDFAARADREDEEAVRLIAEFAVQCSTTP